MEEEGFDLEKEKETTIGVDGTGDGSGGCLYSGCGYLGKKAFGVGTLVFWVVILTRPL